MAVSRVKTSSVLQGFPKSRSLLAGYPGVMPAPTATAGAAGSGSATVAFTAVSGATSYTAISTPGSLTGTGSSSPITVSGLTGGTAYTFQIRATNSNGTGAYSSASNSVTPASLPYYVVVSDNGQAQPNSMNSSDGINWTSANTPSDSSYYKISYTNGTWVATASDSSSPRAITSTNGTTWTNRSLPNDSVLWRGSAANGSTVVCIGGYNATGSPNYNTQRVAYSTDTGATWTGTNTGSSQQWYDIAYGSSGFLSVSVINGSLVYSSNGSTWTTGSFGETREWTKVAFGASKYVVLADDYAGTTYVRYGTPGSWTSTSFSFTNTYVGELIFANNLFVLSGSSYNGGTARIATSSNGVSWTLNNAPSNGNLRSKSYSPTLGLWIMVLRDSTTSYTSPDAITWTARTTSDNKSWQSSATRG